MKLSIFTPTHNPQYLLNCYTSLIHQTAHDIDYEWVIVTNGSITPNDIPDTIRQDEHVKVLHTERKGIGALKHFACFQCSGDVLIELDHDDSLTEDAFAELAAAYEQTPNGFYYSDFINVKPNGRCETYGKQYGWETYPYKIGQRVFTACRAFEPSARSMCQIFYAPNHVRAWSRVAYMKVKGHDVKLTVGDDHDLVCRTYIADIPFVHINKPLYIYRRYSENSFVVHNKDIQKQQQANMDRYLHELIETECRQKNWLIVETNDNYNNKGHTKVNLGGEFYELGDNTVGCVRAYDVLQKIHHRQIMSVMNEVYRVLAPGGWVLTVTPSIDDGKGKPGRGAFQDPSHQSWWSENNFFYLCDHQFAKLVPEYKGRFQQVRLWTDYPSDWHKEHCIPYVHADLSALKGQRQPGITKI